MRYFDQTLLANSALHSRWWDELGANRDFFMHEEARIADAIGNEGPILPRDAWLDLDQTTRRVMRADEGKAWMNDLMPLARAVDIGTLVHLTRVSSDAGSVTRSMSGQVPIPMDKVTYLFRGTPVPIFQGGYGREWREWNTLQNANFDALADDQEAETAKVQRDMALYVLDGDASISVKGYKAYGIRNNPLSKSINIGPSGANIDLTSAATTSAQISNFFSQTLGAMLDANYIVGKVNVYISPDIARNLDRNVSDGAGIVLGTIAEQILKGRRVAKFEVSYELTGNQFFGFVPSSEFIRPLVGMAVNTTAMPRNYPTANYQFLVMGAMGLEIRADINGRTGVFYSVST
jgi:hypothetical protein